MTNLQAPPSRVIAGSEATLALPLGELSPKVTERAWQALTDSPKAFPCSGWCCEIATAPAEPRNDKPESLFIQKTQKARSRSSSLFCIQLNRFRFTALRSRYQCPPVC